MTLYPTRPTFCRLRDSGRVSLVSGGTLWIHGFWPRHVGLANVLGEMMGKWWENDGKMMGKWWGNDGKMMGKWWEFCCKWLEDDAKFVVNGWKMMLKCLQMMGNDGTWGEVMEELCNMMSFLEQSPSRVSWGLRSHPELATSFTPVKVVTWWVIWVIKPMCSILVMVNSG